MNVSGIEQAIQGSNSWPKSNTTKYAKIVFLRARLSACFHALEHSQIRTLVDFSTFVEFYFNKSLACTSVYNLAREKYSS